TMQIMTRREALRAAGSVVAMMTIADPAVAAVPSQPPDAAEALRLVAPELRPAAERWLAQNPRGLALSSSNLAAKRRDLEQHGPLLPDIPVEPRSIPGRRGSPPVSLYLIDARPGMRRPA